jgi:hypothetical protein
MRIGIIGSGMIGGTFGKLWLDVGHEVRYGARDVEKTKRSVDARAGVGSVADVTTWCEVAFLAVPLAATRDVAKHAGPSLQGKPVLDAGNAIPRRDGADGTEAAALGSGAWVQKLLPGARVVKAFNTVHFANIARSGTRETRIGAPLTGDDDKALAVAEQLVRDAGLDPVRVGKLEQSKRIDFGSPVWNSNMSAVEIKKALGV